MEPGQEVGNPDDHWCLRNGTTLAIFPYLHKSEYPDGCARVLVGPSSNVHPVGPAQSSGGYVSIAGFALKIDSSDERSAYQVNMIFQSSTEAREFATELLNAADEVDNKRYRK